MSEETRVPAEVFHVSEIIADECMARGWSVWELAERLDASDVPTTVLALEMYAAAGPDDPHLSIGEDDPTALERVFGVSAEFWRNIAASCRERPTHVAGLSGEAFDWYGLGENRSGYAAPSSPTEPTA